MMLPGFVGVVMRHVVLYRDDGSVRRVGKSQNAAGEAQHEYR